MVAEMRAPLVCCLGATALVGCGSITSAPTAPSGLVEPGTLPTAPSGLLEPGTLVFSGAVNGATKPEKLTCERAGNGNYRYFAVLMEGSVEGKPYFLRLNAYPYHGADTYPSIYHQPELLANHGTAATPDPLTEAAPTGYPSMGFLNFLPKSGSSFSTENRDGASSLTVKADEQSGSFVARLVAAGAPTLNVVGAFVCGPSFIP